MGAVQAGESIHGSARVVVLSGDSLGDQVLRAPLLQGLAASAGEVTVVVQERVAALLPRIDPRLVPLATPLVPWRPGPDPAADRAEEDRLVAAIEALGPDLIVHAPFATHAGLVRILSRLSAYRRVGLARRDRPGAIAEVLDRAIACDQLDHEVEKGLTLLRGLVGAAAASHFESRRRLRLREEDRSTARLVTRSTGLEAGRYVVAAPVATANLAYKRWRADGIAAVIAGIARRHRLPTLLVGATDETELLEEVAVECRRNGAEPPVWAGAPAELPTLLGLIADARLAVGFDSGPMHIAAAFGVPVVAGFSGAYWPRFLPAAERVAIVTRRLPCFDCRWDCWAADPPCQVHEPDPYLGTIEWALNGQGQGVWIHAQRPEPELRSRARAAVEERERRAA